MDTSGEIPMGIQEEEARLQGYLTEAFDNADRIMQTHPTGREAVAILRGKGTVEQRIHIENCPDCVFKLREISRLVKRAYLETFLKERRYR